MDIYDNEKKISSCKKFFLRKENAWFNRLTGLDVTVKDTKITVIPVYTPLVDFRKHPGVLIALVPIGDKILLLSFSFPSLINWEWMDQN
jgi:hypothetical protein